MIKQNYIADAVLSFPHWGNKKGALGFLSILFFLFIKLSNAQIANYVNNGGFEVPKYANSQKAKYWEAIDTTKYVGLMYSAIIPPYLVPLNSVTYQWPRHGNAWFGSTLLYKPSTPQTNRGYPRNLMKGTLLAGKSYCVKFYCNITNNSTYGVDGLGAYFGDNTTDTISHCMTPITYFTPQVQNPNNNIISDTLNWIPITGTFVANGTEKYMILGNFKSDLATNTLIINPTYLPGIFCDVIYDDVSVIDIDLPAYAGPDIWGIPNNAVYLGRPQDVGIDEACMWYQLPNITTAIDTAAGITVTVATTTQTYMVKQDICGNIKYDTVIVYASGVGINELLINNERLKIYPNPVQDLLNIEFVTSSSEAYRDEHIQIINSLGQVIREEEIIFKDVTLSGVEVKTALINTKELANGVYFLKLSFALFDSAQSDNKLNISKRFVITR